MGKIVLDDPESEDIKSNNSMPDLLGNETPKKSLDELAIALPSQRGARLNAIRTAPRVQMNFTGIPEPIKKMFEDRAKKLKISKIQLFYGCLRASGFEIPQNLDKRKMI